MPASQFAQQVATEAQVRSVRWWRMPFSVDTWRRTLYILLALPGSFVAVPAVLLGCYRTAARVQRRRVRRYLAPRGGGPAPSDAAVRVLAHTILSLPLNLCALALTAYLWALVPANLAYPLRPGTMASYQHAWGGPSLAGAWAVHAAGAVVFLFVTPYVVRGLTWLQGGLSDRLLGSGP